MHPVKLAWELDSLRMQINVARQCKEHDRVRILTAKRDALRRAKDEANDD